MKGSPKDISINNRKEHILDYYVSSIIAINQRVADDATRILCWIWIDHLVEVATVLSGCLGNLFFTVHDGGHNSLSFVHEQKIFSYGDGLNFFGGDCWC